MKNVVYGVTRTNVMNVGDATVVAITPWWQVALWSAAGALALLTALCAVLTVREAKRQKTAAKEAAET